MSLAQRNLGLEHAVRIDTYTLPQLTVVLLADATVRILIDGAAALDFPSDDQAQRWLRYVRGGSHAMPRTAPAAAGSSS